MTPSVLHRSVLVIFFSLAGCALNPARNLLPTSEEPEIRLETEALKAELAASASRADEKWGVIDEDLTPEEHAKRKKTVDAEIDRRFFDLSQPGIGPFRGAEKLDEQDFYGLLGDRRSQSAVASARGWGQAESVAGLIFSIFGYGTALAIGGNYALSGGENAPMPRIITSPLGLAVLVGAGLVMGGVGTLMIPDGRSRTNAHLFGHEHALTSLEEYRYGPSGLTPAAVSALQVTSFDGSAPHFCSTDEADLKLVALDQRGRKIILEGRADWFTWVTTPEGLFTHGEEPDEVIIRSPIERSLQAYGKDPVLMVSVNGGTAIFSKTMPHDYDCLPSIGVKGRPGEPGGSGKSGHDGSPGRDGARGNPGYPGANFEIEAARVVAPDGARFVLIAIQQEGAREVKLELVKDGGKVTIETIGGMGGHGGSGGSGGRGRSGGKCQDGNVGGDGADGGDGGTGGKGGDVRVRLADRKLRDLVSVVSRGGEGGIAGRGGSRGSGGTSGSGGSKECGRSTRSGKDGRSGGSGSRGGNGAPGSVTVSEYAPGQMGLIESALSGSGFTLEGVTQPTRRRSR